MVRPIHPESHVAFVSTVSYFLGSTCTLGQALFSSSSPTIPIASTARPPTMSKAKPILIALGVAVLGGGIYFWLFGTQTMFAILARYTYRKVPEVSRVPVPLPDSTVSTVVHKSVSVSEYEVELPWNDVDESKGKTAGSIHVIAFHSGNAFWFSTFPPKDFVNAVMKMAKLDSQRFSQLYGEEAVASDYNFHRIMLQETPSQITPFVSKKQAAAGFMLLMFKGLSMPKAESGIFLVQTPEFKGFQFGNPQAHPARVSDELFDDEGGIELHFFQKTDGSAPVVSQAEINRVIQSIRKLPAATVASNGSGP